MSQEKRQGRQADDPHVATGPEQQFIVLASFDSRRRAEHMLATLRRDFRKQARKGDASALVASKNKDGSLKATQSRVLTAGDFVYTLMRVSLSWAVGFMGLFATAKGTEAGARAVHARESHVGSDTRRIHTILDEAGPGAAVALIRCKDPELNRKAIASASERAAFSWSGSLDEFLATLDPAPRHDWVRAELGEPPGTDH